MSQVKVIISNEQKAVAIPTGIRLLIRRCCNAVLALEKFDSKAERDTFINKMPKSNNNHQFLNKTGVYEIEQGQKGIQWMKDTFNVKIRSGKY